MWAHALHVFSLCCMLAIVVFGLVPALVRMRRRRRHERGLDGPMARGTGR